MRWAFDLRPSTFMYSINILEVSAKDENAESDYGLVAHRTGNLRCSLHIARGTLKPLSCRRAYVPVGVLRAFSTHLVSSLYGARAYGLSYDPWLTWSYMKVLSLIFQSSKELMGDTLAVRRHA